MEEVKKLIRCSGTENNEQCSEPAQLRMTDDDSLLCYDCAKNLRRVGGMEVVLKYVATPLKQRSWMEEPHLWKANWDINKPFKSLKKGIDMILNDKDTSPSMVRDLKKRKKAGEHVKTNSFNLKN